MSDKEIWRVPEMGGVSASASSSAGADERPKEESKQGQLVVTTGVQGSCQWRGRIVGALQGTRSRTG